MNANLSQALAQLRSVWNQLGLNQKVTLSLAILAVLAGLVCVALFSSRVDYALLYGGLRDTEAAKVISALDESKIPYRVSRAGGNIEIPADKVHAVRMQLAGKGIPRAGDGVGFEIFDKPNFGISDFVQRANYLRALQGELGRTISQVDLVESASVIVVLPENRLLLDPSRRPTASVFLRVRGNASLPPQTVNAIRFLVANAVEGLQPSGVSIVDNLGNALTDNNADDSIAGLTTTQLAARKNLELYLARKAEGMLERVLGANQAVVRVSTEINFDTLSRTEEKFDPEGQVLRTSTLDDENTETTSTQPGGGVPGVQTNANTESNSVATASAPVNVSNTRKKTSENKYEINKSTSTLLQGAGGIKRISAAVFVAARMEGTGDTRRAAPRSKEELDKLRRIVQSALGIQEGATGRSDEIALEEIPFNDSPALEAVRQLEQNQWRHTLWSIAGNATYPALALAILLLFARALKRTPTASIPIGIPLGEFAAANGAHSNGYHLTGPAGPAPAGTNGNGHAHGRLGGSRKGPELVTVDVLNQLIRENPDNMTQAIRSWMTRGKPPK